jgi:hypothetical protein
MAPSRSGSAGLGFYQAGGRGPHPRLSFPFKASDPRIPQPLMAWGETRAWPSSAQVFYPRRLCAGPRAKHGKGAARCCEEDAVKETWQVIEQHGIWWAYKGELPPPEAFQTYWCPPNPPILGPCPTRVIAEALLQRHLSRRDPESRAQADSSGALRRVRR